MAGLESLVGSVGTWFGFVGACVAGSGPACRPFLAFVALTAAAGAALALLVLAYKSLQQDEAHAAKAAQPQPQPLPDRRVEPQWRAAAPAAVSRPAAGARGSWRAAA